MSACSYPGNDIQPFAAKLSRSRLREYVSSRIRNPAGLTLESPPDHGSGSAHHGKS